MIRRLAILRDAETDLFYREIEDGIEIVRVLHSAQDVQGVFT